MKKHVCSRCRHEAVIPTHQLLRFDSDYQQLCRDCWEGFRAWFFAGEKIRRYADPQIDKPTDGTRAAS
jgi:hypothetical protein